MDILGLIAVLSFGLTCFGIGYSIGSSCWASVSADVLLYAHGRIRIIVAEATCAPRGEQGRRAFPYLIVQYTMILCALSTWNQKLKQCLSVSVLYHDSVRLAYMESEAETVSFCFSIIP